MLPLLLHQILAGLVDIMHNFELSGVLALMKGLRDIEQLLEVRLFAVDLDRGNDGQISKVLDSKESPGDNLVIQIFAKLQDVFGRKLLEVDSRDRKEINEWLNYAVHQARTLELQAAQDRIDIFNRKLTGAMNLSDFRAEVRALRETFEVGLKSKHFYQYPQQKALLLGRLQSDWSAALRSFPMIAPDVEAAVDCYAFGRNTAAVFHSMRVVEHGLREIAASVNLTFETQQWHIIIEQIESEVRALASKWPQGASKAKWMRFYSEAAKEFFYFKDGWRNYVSHGGDPYDEHQALIVLEHVKAFMNHLASRYGA